MTISTFDKANLKALRPEIDAALAVVAARHGITLTLGNIGFDPGGASFTAKLMGQAASFGEVAAQQAITYARRFNGVMLIRDELRARNLAATDGIEDGLGRVAMREDWRTRRHDVQAAALAAWDRLVAGAKRSEFEDAR